MIIHRNLYFSITGLAFWLITVGFLFISFEYWWFCLVFTQLLLCCFFLVFKTSSFIQNSQGCDLLWTKRVLLSSCTWRFAHPELSLFSCLSAFGKMSRPPPPHPGPHAWQACFSNHFPEPFRGLWLPLTVSSSPTIPAHRYTVQYSHSLQWTFFASVSRIFKILSSAQKWRMKKSNFVL